MTTLYRGDDTNAFNNGFIKIGIENETGIEITKAEFQCGTILKEFVNPVFPLYVNLSKQETKFLKSENACYLRVYDKNGLRQTCEGTLTFSTRQGVINAS